jgi:hypothetical protein
MNCFILKIIILRVASCIYCCQIKEDKMSEECNMDGRNEKLKRKFSGESQSGYTR